VVLLDEIEKAHPDVWNILLQVLDDGHLTDNKGRTVNFKNTIIIMTSNIGSHLIQEAFEDVNDSNVEEKTAQSKLEVMALLKQTIRPEFLNRVDEIIMFSPLLQKQMASIVKIQLNNLKSLVAENGMQVDFSDYLVEYLSEQGFDLQLGARPLKRLIQKMVVNEFSKKILSGEIDKTKKILIDIFDGVVVFRNEA
jgi:ATP-dependent Clp protease ATP-binding subunit ClpB